MVLLAAIAIAAAYLVARYTGVTLRAHIGWMLLLAGVIYIGHDIVRLNMTGLALLGVVHLILALWLLGVFRRDFWIATITEDHPDALGSLDIAERAHRREHDR